MKRGTPRHPKMYALAHELTIPLPYAVGIMEMLWHHAAQYTPRGNIGSIPDVAIAQACAFSRKPSILIDALVSAGWLDVSEEHRLIIHGWEEHCDQSVRKWLERNGKCFAPCPDGVQSVSGQHPTTDDGQHPPSREAMAEALVVVVKKKKTSLLSEKQQVWFSEFWAAYWRRIGKGAAEAKFAEEVTTQDLFDRVMQALRLQAPWMLQRDSDRRPYPATWLNQKRWEDDADVVTTNGTRQLTRSEQIERAFEAI